MGLPQGQGDETKADKATQGPGHTGSGRLPRPGATPGPGTQVVFGWSREGWGELSFLPFFLSFSFFFLFFLIKGGDKGSCQEALSSKV